MLTDGQQAVILLVAATLGGFAAGSCTRTRPAATVAQPEPLPSGAAVPPTTHPPVATTPEYGSVLVIYRTAEGEERTITCGGEVSHGRQLEKLDRSGP